MLTMTAFTHSAPLHRLRKMRRDMIGNVIELPILYDNCLFGSISNIVCFRRVKHIRLIGKFYWHQSVFQDCSAPTAILASSMSTYGQGEPTYIRLMRSDPVLCGGMDFAGVGSTIGVEQSCFSNFLAAAAREAIESARYEPIAIPSYREETKLIGGQESSPLRIAAAEEFEHALICGPVQGSEPAEMRLDEQVYLADQITLSDEIYVPDQSCSPEANAHSAQTCLADGIVMSVENARIISAPALSSSSNFLTRGEAARAKLDFTRLRFASEALSAYGGGMDEHPCLAPQEEKYEDELVIAGQTEAAWVRTDSPEFVETTNGGARRAKSRRHPRRMGHLRLSRA